jgi:predicted acyltransferase
MEPTEPQKDQADLTIKSVPIAEKTRVRWIDHARGFVMVFLVITSVFPPGEWKQKDTNPILWWLSSHPSPFSADLTLYDIGVPAFMFIIGLSMAISFNKWAVKESPGKAALHQAKRYFILLILGILLAWVLEFKIWNTKTYPVTPGPNDTAFYPEFAGLVMNYVIIWDVVIAIAFTGYCTIPFLFIKDGKLRMIVAYAWMLLYGILFQVTNLRAYAQLSVHGGIFGTIFTLTSITVIGSAVGEYAMKSPDPMQKKARNMAIFGAINLLIGFIIDAIPGWEATKRQGSFSYGVISIGVVMLGATVFALIDLYRTKPIAYLDAFGKNPFFTYFIAEVPIFILDETTGDDLGLGPIGNILVLAILLTYTSLILMYLYKKQKIISTEKASLIFLITAVVLAALLLGTGVVEL